MALYGIVLFCAAAAYFILERVIISHYGKESLLANVVGEGIKGKISVAIYALAIPAAFVWPILSCVGYIIVAMMWIVPDRRIEKILN